MASFRDVETWNFSMKLALASGRKAAAALSLIRQSRGSYFFFFSAHFRLESRQELPPPVDSLFLTRWILELLPQSCGVQCLWSGLARSGTGDRVWLALLSPQPPVPSTLYLVRFGDPTAALPLLLCVTPIGVSSSADVDASLQLTVSRALEFLLGSSELLFSGDDKVALLCAAERCVSAGHSRMNRQEDEQSSEKLERVKAYLSSLPN
ncbi:unnamed protein product [Schistocephalus solidus]|uniref:Uncharacterized protein n=1 Tax=Schistocephalus solidus TaxID=70667 RepID=A0A183SV93_SCHSO|nr:unnamed protein product [Schistocephalus solidus]